MHSKAPAAEGFNSAAANYRVPDRLQESCSRVASSSHSGLPGGLLTPAAANRLGAWRSDHDIFQTFEGDNTVLMQQASKGWCWVGVCVVEGGAGLWWMGGWAAGLLLK